MQNKVKSYAISIIISLGIGGISALLTAGNMDLYSDITKPPLSPPGILFPIVWSVLYVLMGIGCAMIYTERSNLPIKSRNALILYGVNLFLNFFWSIIFFNARAFLFAFIWLILLWITIVIMTIKFCRIRPLAGLLQIPYLLWVSFAGYLNLAIYILNR